jgi:hypothetical protein
VWVVRHNVSLPRSTISPHTLLHVNQIPCQREPEQYYENGYQI